MFTLSQLKYDAEREILQISTGSEFRELEREIPLRGTLRSIDTNLSNELALDKLNGLDDEEETKQIELPADEFAHPIALIFEEGDVLLIWMTSEDELKPWVSLLSIFTTNMPPENNFILRSEMNRFTTTLYKFMQRKQQQKQPSSSE